jgi:molybdopterin converting factor subunit 1
MATSIDDTNNKKMSFHITVLFFASAREAAGGVSKMDLEIVEQGTTSSLRNILAEKYPKLAAMVLDEDSLTLALNEEYVASGQVIDLKAGDTVALIPPISGG